MSVRVDPFNPFEMNRVGIGGPSSPFPFQREQQGSVWTAHGAALRAIDFVDLAAGLLGLVSVICNIGQTAFLDAEGNPFQARKIALEQGVAAWVHDLAWATMSGSSTYGDVLVVQSSDLERFFSGWSLYDVDLFDSPTDPSLEQCEEAMLAMNTRRSGDPPLLSTLDLPTMYFGGHDDCYFYAESRDERLSCRIMSRLLAVLAGATLLKHATDDVIVPEPDEGFASRLFGQSDAWVGAGRLDGVHDVIVELTPGDWRLGQRIPHDPSVIARLARDSGTWTMQPAA